MPVRLDMTIPRQNRLPLGAGDAFRAAASAGASRGARVYPFPARQATVRGPTRPLRPVAAHRASAWGALGDDPLDRQDLRPRPDSMRADLAPAPRRGLWVAAGLAFALLAPLGLWAAGWLR
jgi:hypothetical protein